MSDMIYVEIFSPARTSSYDVVTDKKKTQQPKIPKKHYKLTNQDYVMMPLGLLGTACSINSNTANLPIPTPTPVILAQYPLNEKVIAEVPVSKFYRFNDEILDIEEDTIILENTGKDKGIVVHELNLNTEGATHFRITFKNNIKKEGFWTRLRLEIIGDKKIVAEQKMPDSKNFKEYVFGSPDATYEIPRDLSKRVTIYVPVEGMKKVDSIVVMIVGYGEFQDLEISKMKFIKK